MVRDRAEYFFFSGFMLGLVLIHLFESIRSLCDMAVFQVRMTAIVMLQGQASALPASVTTALVAVNAAPSPLVARIVGGDRQVWFVLDF